MNRSQLEKFAPIGLYVSLLALLVSAGLYIVQRSFTLPLQISLGMIVVGVAAYALMAPRRLREALTGRQARYGSNALVLTVAFLGILVVINYLIYKNPVRWDLTEDKQHTLSKETLETLASLKDKDPIKAEAFYSSRFPSDTARDLLDSYQYNSGGKFTYEFIDPEQDPVRAQSANVTRDGTIVLYQSGRSEQVTYASEEEITSALIKLTNPGERAVYFLVGHGEYSPDETSDRSYRQVKSTLSNKNYTVNTLNLLATRSIPEDAKAVVIAGPEKPVSQEEVDLLKAYLEKGGSLIFLSEPPVVTQALDAPDPLIEYLKQTWGIQMSNDMVIDLNYNPPSVAISASYGNHSITQKMYNQAIVLPSARSLEVQTAPQDVQVTVLAQTARNSWAEKDISSLKENKVGFDEKTDLPGPITLAVAAENSSTKARVVVIGDSDFASDNNFLQYGNSDFLINSIDWAAKQENLINLTPKSTTQRILIVRSQTTLGLILLVSVFLLPGLVIVAGVVVWVQRKRRG
uniref:Uncharacterized protein n=1 Tax=Anaerolinea thermolimosa TaxID=229919 RepID=A0A7C4KI28_9CHLR